MVREQTVVPALHHDSDDAGTNTHLLLYIPTRFYRIDIQEDAGTHKAISCKHLSRSICTVVEES